MKQYLVLGLLGLSLAGSAVWAHEGHQSDPLHQHRLVQGTEVALQVMSAKDYQQYLKLHKLPAQKLSAPYVLLVVLERNQVWLKTRVRLKVTATHGESIGPAAGIDPLSVQESKGPHYAFPVALQAGKSYFVMVQFAENGLQRVGFQLPKLPAAR